MSRHYALGYFLVVSFSLGCGDAKKDVSKERLEKMAGGALKNVVPVSGTVRVDGEPKAGVNLYLHPDTGGEAITTCRTKEDGTYCWSTYTTCDGLPAGKYRLAFRLVPQMKRNDRNEASDDLFKGKFANPGKIEYLLTVEDGSPQTDANYELSTK